MKCLLMLWLTSASQASLESGGIFENTLTEEAMSRGEISIHWPTPSFDELGKDSRVPESESTQSWNLILQTPSSDPLAELPHTVKGDSIPSATLFSHRALNDDTNT